jgi:predicted nucleic acid-binding protein
VIAVDASATVHLLLGTSPQGEWVAEQLADNDVHVPHLLDVEVANALRNLAARAVVSTSRARAALESLYDLDVVRHPHLALLGHAWRLRANLTAYDATYVGLAELLGVPLVTTDGRLSRAPGVRATILTP